MSGSGKGFDAWKKINVLAHLSQRMVMEKERLDREIIAMRVARELQDGDVVIWA